MLEMNAMRAWKSFTSNLQPQGRKELWIKSSGISWFLTEYASAVSYYQSQDKLTKGKMASSLISMNAEMLMLSRSFNYGVWTCVQYGTSDLFHGEHRIEHI